VAQTGIVTDLTLDLRFVREHGILSDIIDRCTSGFFNVGPRWSHVGVLAREGRDEFGARSATDKAYSGRSGVQFRPADYAAFVAQDIVRIPVTAEEHAAFWRLAKKTDDAPYSHRTILGFVAGNNDPERKGYLAFDCSTLVAWMLLHSSADLMPPAFRGELRQISPNALYDIARVIAFYHAHHARTELDAIR
jgi:hypothetical protein